MKLILRQTTISLLVLFSISSSALTVVAQKAENEYQVGAILWTQSSGEKAALSYQAFALARMTLDRDLRLNRRNRMKRAIIVDVDETILDNSRYQGMLVQTHRAYASQTWTEWCNRAQATALPGAVEFLQYVNSRGVRVFYVTNRKDVEKEGTARNLKQVGFPDVTDETSRIQRLSTPACQRLSETKPNSARVLLFCLTQCMETGKTRFTITTLSSVTKKKMRNEKPR